MPKIKHKRTGPYTPRINGKAERFVQTSLPEWAYTKPSNHSSERAPYCCLSSTIIET
jgi:transposase InsO family protein